MWEYYLAYCEAGFASRSLGTLQMVLTRPNNAGLGSCPGYR
jgi:cyclopropane-fatty-acyl-phospholipid synthase